MLSLRGCRILACRSQKSVVSATLSSAFSSKGKDPKTHSVTVTVPKEAEKNKQYDEHANWELLGRRGYRFILPGNVGLSLSRRKALNLSKKSSRTKKNQSTQVSLPDTNYFRHVEIVTQLAVLASEVSELSSIIKDEPKEFQVKAVDCPFLLREQVIDLFPNAGLGYGPLTAVCVALRGMPAGSEKTEKYWLKVIDKFEHTARRVCDKLNQAGYWAEFPTDIEFDMNKMSTDVSASQIEALSMLKSPGPRIVHLSGCIILMHPPIGESRVLGWLFTTAPFDNHDLEEIINAENGFS
ncbi:uncharacterized protein LOC132203462 [Neocloeon triangulifer]|uniref:uncharacterized protein LOC132203462 n=1 Tax=Neocloeon triangulifer TaxID=2078957 RepID=UPI00286F6A30|nr:uncharacterized protein LOC132203462 [Neocloeon triangulifer]